MSDQERDDLIIRVTDYLRNKQGEDGLRIYDRDFELIFAESVEGELLGSPVGLANIVKGKIAWFIKIVVVSDSLRSENVSVKVGICRPDYSYGITDTHVDVAKTGHAVLNIWNERIYSTFDYYEQVIQVVLAVSNDYKSFCLFEEDIHRYCSNDYEWSIDSSGNLIGKSIVAGAPAFTWQPKGSNLIIHEEVPNNAVHFILKDSQIVPAI